MGLPPEAAVGYQFASVKIKEKAFRFDGIFMNQWIKIFGLWKCGGEFGSVAKK